VPRLDLAHGRHHAKRGVLLLARRHARAPAGAQQALACNVLAAAAADAARAVQTALLAPALAPVARLALAEDGGSNEEGKACSRADRNTCVQGVQTEVGRGQVNVCIRPARKADRNRLVVGGDQAA
jgi:hypothetical protein